MCGGESGQGVGREGSITNFGKLGFNQWHLEVLVKVAQGNSGEIR